MGNIGIMILVALMVLAGGAASLYILITMPIIIVRKIYGKVKYGKSRFD